LRNDDLDKRVACHSQEGEGPMRNLILPDYRLTTAEILYHLPDHPLVLQTYVWQDLDIAPKFPVLRRFLDFWRLNLDGKLHMVRVASSQLMRPAEFKFAASLSTLH